MRIVLLCVCCMLMGISTLLAQNKELDSLRKLLPLRRDTAKINLLIDIGWKARNVNPILSIEHTRQAVKMARELKREDLEGRALNYMGVGYRNIGNYKQALECFFTGSKLSEKTKDFESVGYNLQSIGDIYNRRGRYEDAIPYILDGLKVFKRINNLSGVGYCYYTLGQIYHNQAKYQQAIESFRQASEIRQKLNDKDGLATVKNRLGMAYRELKDYDNALQYHEEALKVYEGLGSKRNIVWANLCIAQVYKATKRYPEAIKLIEQNIPLAQKIQAKDHLKEMYAELSACYEGLMDYPQAHKNAKLFIVYKDSALAVSTLQEIEYLQVAYDKEKKDREFEELKNKQRTEHFFFYAVLGGFLLIILFVLLFVWFLIRGNRKHKRNNKLLAEKNAEILAQRDAVEAGKREIELKNEYISSSIMYAKTIQDAVLPARDLMRNIFPEHFIINFPKDVVSGDFYWLRVFGDGYILVGADCTGHGVAGAFMTLIGGTLLDKITEAEKVHSPQEILNRLHVEISKLLQQDQTGNTNGMDAVVLYVVPRANEVEITFCGAKNSLYYTVGKDVEIQKLAGTRKGIGGIQNENIHFANQTITLPKDSMLYFGSDGLIDQNDHKRKRLGETRLRNLLQEMATLPMAQQQQHLIQYLLEFMENTIQRDDILWIGIRV
ncbi:MAG: hypothetical protein EAZ95_08140 [Bacteroidetes bacterium]|nr:MAG: hypothetical protein EAZ95_08140 [Bacteroidota bacterium]